MFLPPSNQQTAKSKSSLLLATALCTLRSDSPTLVDLLHGVTSEAVVRRELKDVRPLAELASSDVASSEDSRLQQAADWRCVFTTLIIHSARNTAYAS